MTPLFDYSRGASPRSAVYRGGGDARRRSPRSEAAARGGGANPAVPAAHMSPAPGRGRANRDGAGTKPPRFPRCAPSWHWASRRDARSRAHSRPPQTAPLSRNRTAPTHAYFFPSRRQCTSFFFRHRGGPGFPARNFCRQRKPPPAPLSPPPPPPLRAPT